ncbi:hypothetical protein chiPu_0032799, partial [Chiloscyllium punctatum]|nr:hypothetical protein [Chiloscyllium punctatum]
MPLQRTAGRTDLERALDRRIDAAAGCDIELDLDRLHSDAGETGFAQDALHPGFGSKRKRAGILGAELRQLRHVLVDRLQRRHEERVFARLLPAGEGEPATLPHRSAQIGERRHRIGKEHHAEARGQQIKTLAGERIDGRVGKREFDRQSLRRTLPRPRQHRPGDIDAEHVARGHDL